jgi:hypothetical protein
MDGGALSVSQGGQAITVWRRENTIYAAKPHGSERRLGLGEQPTIAATPSGPCIAWIDRRPGNLLLMCPGSSKPLPIADHAADPVLAAATDGAGPVVLLWESGPRDHKKILARVFSTAK